MDAFGCKSFAVQYQLARGKASFGLQKAAQLLLGCPSVFVQCLQEGRLTAKAAAEEPTTTERGAGVPASCQVYEQLF